MLNAFLRALGTLTVAALPPTSALAQGWKVHHLLPAGSYANTRFIRPWCDKIAQDSADKLKSRIYPSMQLAARRAFEQVRTAWPTSSGRCPATRRPLPADGVLRRRS